MVSKKITKKGQSFSTDIIVVVVIVLFGALFLVINQISSEESGPTLEEKYDQASLQSKLIVDKLREEQVLDSENQVNVERLLEVDEAAIREELNIEGEFAIVFEKDGKLVRIDPENNINCVGSDKIIINGESCK